MEPALCLSSRPRDSFGHSDEILTAFRDAKIDLTMKRGDELNKFRLIPLSKADAVKRKRLSCPKCRSVMFHVDYGQLAKPKKGKRKVGFFGTCIVCNEVGRLHSGKSQ